MGLEWRKRKVGTTWRLEVRVPTKYYESLLSEWKLQKAKAAPTPAVKGKKREGEEEDMADHATYARYIRSVGRCWLLPVRPDMSYTIKELSRDNSKPSERSVHGLKRCLKYVQGTK